MAHRLSCHPYWRWLDSPTTRDSGHCATLQPLRRKAYKCLGQVSDSSGRTSMKSNLRVPEGVQDAGRATNRAARNAASSHLMTVLPRFGYAAKGIVYLIIAWLVVEDESVAGCS